MTTITLKINEKTTAGKALLSIVNLISSKNNGFEVCDAPNFEITKAMYKAENKIVTTQVLERFLYFNPNPKNCVHSF